MLLLYIFLLFSLVNADPAPESHDNPPDISYSTCFGEGNLQGQLVFYSDGFVLCYGSIEGLPISGAPYSYAIHQRAVPLDNNCRGARGILDPYDGDRNPKTLAEYRVGDLSGKYGTIKGTSIEIQYDDKYISLNPKNPAYIGDKSVVVRDKDGNRIICSNIEKFQATEKGPGSAKQKAEESLAKLKAKKNT